MAPWRRMPAWAAALAAALLSFSCATGSVLNVTYQLPGPGAPLSAREIALAVEDARGERTLLTPRARQELEGVSEVFALTVAAPGREAELRGAFPLEPLLQEILRLRLEQAGIRVGRTPSPEARLVLALQEWRLDFGDRRWTASIAFETRIERGAAVASRQSVRGAAERMMIRRKADAEKVLSEILTDAVNQLDLAGLLRQAGL
ncbi:MAG: hypothetical protein WHT06_09190 [Desulfobacterales bacterium]